MSCKEPLPLLMLQWCHLHQVTDISADGASPLHNLAGPIGCSIWVTLYNRGCVSVWRHEPELGLGPVSLHMQCELQEFRETGTSHSQSIKIFYLRSPTQAITSKNNEPKNTQRMTVKGGASGTFKTSTSWYLTQGWVRRLWSSLLEVVMHADVLGCVSVARSTISQHTSPVYYH